MNGDALLTPGGGEEYSPVAAAGDHPAGDRRGLAAGLRQHRLIERDQAHPRLGARLLDRGEGALDQARRIVAGFQLDEPEGSLAGAA
jgi:hypothetical protein